MRKKLRQKNGVSVVISLVVFLILTMISMVIVNAALSNVLRLMRAREEEQAYLAVTGAAEQLVGVMDALVCEVTEETKEQQYHYRLSEQKGVSYTYEPKADMVGTAVTPTYEFAYKATKDAPAELTDAVMAAIGDKLKIALEPAVRNAVAYAETGEKGTNAGVAEADALALPITVSAGGDVPADAFPQVTARIYSDADDPVGMIVEMQIAPDADAKADYRLRLRLTCAAREEIGKHREVKVIADDGTGYLLTTTRVYSVTCTNADMGPMKLYEKAAPVQNGGGS